MSANNVLKFYYIVLLLILLLLSSSSLSGKACWQFLKLFWMQLFISLWIIDAIVRCFWDQCCSVIGCWAAIVLWQVASLDVSTLFISSAGSGSFDWWREEACLSKLHPAAYDRSWLVVDTIPCSHLAVTSSSLVLDIVAQYYASWGRTVSAWPTDQLLLFILEDKSIKEN